MVTQTELGHVVSDSGSGVGGSRLKKPRRWQRGVKHRGFWLVHFFSSGTYKNW